MKIENPNLRDFYTKCPIRSVLDHLADRWTILVMVELLEGTRRFTELRKAIPDISPRMLAQTLRQLEHNGLVSRTAFPTIPPRVDYAMTELGSSFDKALQPLVIWAAEHHEEVLAARARTEETPENSLASKTIANRVT